MKKRSTLRMKIVRRV